MKFIDEVVIETQGGRGGDGSSAMRREKYIPLGGPSGGDGGKGGSVIFVAHEGLHTLIDLKYRRVIRAEDGEHGRGKDQYGKTGRDCIVRVPVGTQVFDLATNVLIVDFDHHGQECVVAKGGAGGLGNKHFVTSIDRAPRKCEPGRSGDAHKLRLELKLMADVGLVGLPNAGKSTFLSKVSRARPKIADYPFTTLTPQLGVVWLGEERSFVIADIPGIIEGAAQGAGLGLQFLRHIERTRVLLLLVTQDLSPERDPYTDYQTLIREIGEFSESLLDKPRVVAYTQWDRKEARDAFKDFKKKLGKKERHVFCISSVSAEGLKELLFHLEEVVGTHAPVRTTSVNPLPI